MFSWVLCCVKPYLLRREVYTDVLHAFAQLRKMQPTSQCIIKNTNQSAITDAEVPSNTKINSITYSNTSSK